MHEATCPDCGRAFRAKTVRGANGAVRMHKCTGRAAPARAAAPPAFDEAPPRPRRGPCDHMWRVLRGGDRRTAEGRALADGQHLVCEECRAVASAGEVRWA